MPPSTNRQSLTRPKRHRSLLTLGLLLLACAGFAWLALHRQAIYDAWRLQGYHAPSAIATLATQDTMTSYARKIFYVNHPSLDNGPTFAEACPNNGGEQTIVLGCYHSNQDGIYLLNVSDARLNGVEQVTAAHEMLHAAYDRLSSSERQRVDAMLEDYYQHDLTDPRLIATIAEYKKTEPNDVVNEMHSVFGTEVAQLPAPLEQYYKRYFTDRGQIAAYAAQYQAEFTSRQTTVTQDDAQLTSWKTQITNEEADLKTQLSTINAQQSRLLVLRSSSPTAYNAAVPGFNQLVDSYNREANSLQSLIDQYNQLVAARNSVAFEEGQLTKELSNPTSQQLTQ